MRQILILSALIITISSCRKNILNNCFSESATGRIIGVHPCAHFVEAKPIYGAGFAIELQTLNSKDTFVTYKVPEGLFDFKPEYIDGSYSSYLFRPEVQDLFKIKFSYKLLSEAEKTSLVCNGMINLADFHAAVKGREISISCITKQ